MKITRTDAGSILLIQFQKVLKQSKEVLGREITRDYYLQKLKFPEFNKKLAEEKLSELESAS